MRMQEKKKVRKICIWIVGLLIAWSLVLTSSATTILVEDRVEVNYQHMQRKGDLPDLVVDDVALTVRTGSYKIIPTIKYTVKNIGDEKSDEFEIEVKARCLPLLRPIMVLKDLVKDYWSWERHHAIQGLEPREKFSRFMDRDLEFPEGFVIVKAEVDPENKIKELNELNNEYTSLWFTALGVYNFEIWSQKNGSIPF